MRRLDTYDQWLNEEAKSDSQLEKQLRKLLAQKEDLEKNISDIRHRLGFKDESAIAKHLTKEQIGWCNKHIKVPWSVNDKGEVTVVDDLEFKSKSMIKRFPVQFAPVKGSFNCDECPNLVSLEGAPARVGGNFNCSRCPKLTSLEGAPAHVGRYFYCDNCPNLASLEGAPVHVGGGFICNGCPKLASLEGAPAHVGNGFDCSICPELTSLEGAPAHVGGWFDCNRCPKLASLEGAPAHVGGWFNCGRCDKLPGSFKEIIEDYNDNCVGGRNRIDWKQAHKMIHSETARKAYSLGLI